MSALLLLPCSVGAQQSTIKDPLIRWMNSIAQNELQQRQRLVDQIHTVAQAEERKKVVRQKLLEDLGGLPDYNGPLNARVTGELKADGYTIEKVLFESLPHFYVTGDLYRPNQPGRHPAILYQSGHTQEGKPEPQRAAANLALKGFVVFCTDPIGQGEREQTFNKDVSAPLAGWSVPEHIQSGAEAILIGESAARFFIWDAKRAIDYMVTRPDVDANRLGAAGCSGGGALTTMIGAMDPRLKAVVPACYPSSMQLIFAGPDPDTEMVFPNFLGSGLDVADFVEVTAPTPWLLQATQEDYFTPAGVRLTYDDARRFYSIYGAEDKIGFFIGHGPHGTPPESRRAVYRWMIKWLNNGQGDDQEQPIHMFNNFELLVTPTGHVDDLPGSRKVYQLILDDLKAREHPESVADLKALLQQLKIPTDHTAPEMTILDEQDTPQAHCWHIKYQSEPGVDIEGYLYVPPSPAGRKPGVVLVEDAKPYFQYLSIEELANRMAAKGRVVLTLYPRDSPGELTHAPFVGNWVTDSRANQIGMNMAAMRAHDILRGVDLLAARTDVDASDIRASARAVKGIWLLYAAAADPRIKKIWIDRTPTSLREALHNTLNTNLFDADIPGFALHWDLDDVVKALDGRPVLWTDPANWMNKVADVKGPYLFRYNLGDTFELADAQDEAYLEEFLK